MVELSASSLVPTDAPPDGSIPTRMAYSVELTYKVNQPGADFLFNVQAARTKRQRLVSEFLELSPAIASQEFTDPLSSMRLLRLRADTGLLVVRYRCVIDLIHARNDPAEVPETWVCSLPGEVLPFLYPSRYCESDILSAFANQQFGSLFQGYSRVQTICDWVQRHIVFTPGSSDATTTAVDTFKNREGVCRDFAHLMIALCRALNLPARFATGFDYGADPALGPTDFHAYVEVYLGCRWYIFDPTGMAIPMGLVRLASGRDASDCAYATIFGDVTPLARWLTVALLAESDSKTNAPMRFEKALSTDDGPTHCTWRRAVASPMLPSLM
ncbi:transglutaminase-like domain-containing protein [Variovorax soli]|uniref:transglutaminase-like domain-containing protein n=1 Tax=Variovorax soli TaxID=376815 RepID=UPI000A067201|nr:transglutaminase family protein [Variovorax soli]